MKKMLRVGVLFFAVQSCLIASENTNEKWTIVNIESLDQSVSFEKNKDGLKTSVLFRLGSDSDDDIFDSVVMVDLEKHDKAALCIQKNWKKFKYDKKRQEQEAKSIIQPQLRKRTFSIAHVSDSLADTGRQSDDEGLEDERRSPENNYLNLAACVLGFNIIKEAIHELADELGEGIREDTAFVWSGVQNLYKDIKDAFRNTEGTERDE
jgi:hypothetical protein